MAAVRALFVSEDHGTQIMGPRAFEDALLLGLADRDDVEGRFVRIGRSGLAGRLASRAVPLLHRADLDFQHLRWFLAHSVRLRRRVAAELARSPADVVLVNTHALTLGVSPVPAGLPLLVTADATVWDWRAMSRSVPVRGHSERLYALCRRLESAGLRRARTVLAYTDWARERLRAAAPGADVRLLRPGIDLGHYRPAPRRPDGLRVVFVGGRFAEKGGYDLLAALEHRLGRDVELDVVTAEPPPQRPGVHVHALERGDPALLALLQGADLFCLPTYADTMSFATMEAMACGTVPVVSALAGIPEVVGDAGRTVPPGDVRGLRQELDALLDDPERRHELGRRARARAEREFDARRQSSLLLDAVCEAAAGL